MPFDPSAFIETLAPHDEVVVLVMSLAATLEAVLGLGVLVPGETAVATGAAVLGDRPLLLLAWLTVAVGACLGDHVGYLLGRRSGPALGESRLVRRLGRHRWQQTTNLLRHRAFWIIVIARLIPGIRTLVSAAAGATGLSWGRFALADAVASAVWATLWVLGGALLFQALLGTSPCILALTASTLALAGTTVVSARRRVVAP